MPLLMIIGTSLAVLGLCILGYCIITAASLRSSKDSDSARAAALQRLIALNYAALGSAVVGLCMMVIGMVL